MSYVNRFSCMECLLSFDTQDDAADHVRATENPMVPLPNPHRVYPVHTYVDDQPTAPSA